MAIQPLKLDELKYDLLAVISLRAFEEGQLQQKMHDDQSKRRETKKPHIF